MEAERSETNDTWRALVEQERARKAECCAQALARLNELQAAGELTYRTLNGPPDGPTHVRIQVGRTRVDLWPSNGRWRPVGDRGQVRKDGLAAVLRFLGVGR